MNAESLYPNWKLKIIFAHLYVQHRTKMAAQLRANRARWKLDPEWRKKENAYQRKRWHESGKFKDDKEKRRAREREKWRTDPEFRAKKMELRKILSKRPIERLKRSQWRKKHYDANPWQKFVNSARSRIWASLKERGRKKWGSVAELVGCSREQMLSHIESQFESGMSWSNHGVGEGMWHIDHVRPLASFDLSTLESQKEAFSYKNTKPMWGELNLSKASVYDGKKWKYSDHIKQAA